MLKTIAITQVTLGMYIHKLNGAWIDHPFWKTKFVLDGNSDLQKLQSSDIKEIVIDVSKGLDVQVDIVEPTDAVESVGKLSQDALSKANSKPLPKRISAQQEQKYAARIIKQSKKAVASMFKDVRLGKAVSTDAVMPLVEGISNSISRNQGALVSLARLKNQDDYTYMHSVAVCALMTALAMEMALSETEVKQAGLAGLLHDLGKAAIPLDVLNKPFALTDQEFDLIKKHPELGHQMLIKAGITDAAILDVCLHHHEKIDGSGYPQRLLGDNISLFAKMGAVCDVYDALTSDRSYKTGWGPGVALQRMAKWTNHFDPAVFKAFIKSVGIYPIGSVVMLKSGRLGVVIDQHAQELLKPIVKVFFSTKSKSRIAVESIDLSKPSAQDEIVGHETAADWGIDNVHELWTEPSV